MTITEDSKAMRWDSPHGPDRPGRNGLAVFGAIAVAIVLTTVGVALGVRELSQDSVWERFDTVKPGVLYRSGQLTSEQLKSAIDRYGIRTVVNFQVRDRTLATEEALVRSLGSKFVNLPMPGDGFGEERQFREFLALVDDPANRPLLIHCAAGTCRTGAAVALYRFERDGWSIDDVTREMERQAYDTGWLSGYVFNMTKTKPQAVFRDESAGASVTKGTSDSSKDPMATNADAREPELRR